ncbi:MAG: DUF11 domain-containing protein, partial [Planctomycetales bacterium]
VLRVNTPAWADIASVQVSRGVADPSTRHAGEPLQWRVAELDAHSSELLTLRIVPRKNDAFSVSVDWNFSPVSSQALIQVQEPKLGLQIEGPGEVRFGETQVYRIRVSNPGTGDAEEVKLQLMPLDGGSQPMAVQQLGTIEAGDQQELEVELTAREAGYLSVRAVVLGAGDLRTEVVERVLVRRAGLLVTTEGPKVKYAGTLATYQFRIENPGNATAEQIEIVATPPAGAKYIGCSNGGRLNEEGLVEWSLDSLSAGSDQLFQIQTTLLDAGNNVFRVQVEAAEDLSYSGTASTQVEAVSDLKLEVSDPRGPVPAGEEVVYEIRIINRGSKAAENIDVAGFFSKGVEPISVLGGKHDLGEGQVIFKPISTLAAGDQVVYKIVARASRGGNHVFRAEVECEETGVRLAAEETTRFYENRPLTARKPQQPEAQKAVGDVKSTEKVSPPEAAKPAAVPPAKAGALDVPAYRRSN